MDTIRLQNEELKAMADEMSTLKSKMVELKKHLLDRDAAVAYLKE